MTVPLTIFNQALAAAGIVGVGQTALAQDVTTAQTLFDEMIAAWAQERLVKGIPGAFPAIADSTTDIPFWTPYEAALLWGLTARLRAVYGLPPDDVQIKLAETNAALLQANNKQFQPAPTAATVDTTGNGLAFLALRAAGRITDEQGVDAGAQDLTDAVMLLVEMLDEWQRERTVTVTAGTLPVIIDPTAAISVTLGMRSAIVWNLAVRIRSAFGQDENKTQMESAARALALLQANNKQQAAPLQPGVPATALQIVFQALRMAGRVNDTQSVAIGSQDVDDAFNLLVAMLAQWSRERWLTFDLADVACLSTGAESYTIGAGGNFNVARPDRIESAFVRLNPGSSQPIDYDLDILESREDYNDIGLKYLSSFPSVLFYDSAYPMGTIYVSPVPMTGLFEIHVSVKATLPVYADTSASLGLPPEYNQALYSNLACRIASWNGGQPTQFLVGLARASLQVIRGANAQVPRLGMPNGIPGRWSNNGVNWLGGASYGSNFLDGIGIAEGGLAP